MPWTIEDVESHFKGLSTAQKERWVAVANDARTRCLDKGGTDCDSAAIRQANAVVSKMAVQGFILYPIGETNGFERGSIEPIGVNKGISTIVGDGEVIAFVFDARPPRRWTEENIAEWMAKKVGSLQFTCAAPSEVSIPSDDSEIPETVMAAKNELIQSGADSDPMVVRIHQTTGKFHTGRGVKFNLSERFLRTFGPSYINKPAYEGHKGFGDTDARSRIGKILAFEERDGKFFFWLHVSAGRPDIRARIREEMALKQDDDEASGVQFSLEGWPRKVETDADGYHEPVEMDRQGKALALVEVAGATGTMIDRIAAKLAVQTITEEEDMSEKNTPLGVEDITKQEKFEEAFAARLSAYAGAALDEKNPLTAVIDKFLTEGAPVLAARAQAIDTEVQAALTAGENRVLVLNSATKEEMPWLAAFGEAVKELTPEAIKELPAFDEALKSVKAEELQKIPAAVDAIAARGAIQTEAMKLSMQVLKDAGFQMAAPNAIVGAAQDGGPGEEEKRFMAIVAKAK